MTFTLITNDVKAFIVPLEVFDVVNAAPVYVMK